MFFKQLNKKIILLFLKTLKQKEKKKDLTGRYRALPMKTGVIF